MLRKITFLAFCFLAGLNVAFAQKCGFDKSHQKLLLSNPSYAASVQQIKQNAANFVQNNPNALIVNTPNGPVYQIPLVIHVMHTGGSLGSNYNPGDAQLIAMVNYLNQTFSATWPAYPNTSNGGTFIPIQFALAQRDPSCNTTNGIVRVNAGTQSATYLADGITTDFGIEPGEDDPVVKAMSIWPNTEYYNIWIVNKIDGEDGFNSTSAFTAGYAYFPGAGSNIDGTVMLAYSANAGSKTLPHEIGHAMGVHHTFQGDAGGTTCPTNNNCATDGDEVCDTEPHIRSVFNCTPNANNSCVTPNAPYGNVVKNIMDYSGCPDLRFTTGQANRMMAALLSPDRASLISSLGATAIGTTPAVATCNPSGITNTAGNRGPRNITISDASLTYMGVSSSGYTGDGNQHYIDNTCKHVADITAGNTYNFSVSTGGGTQNVKVFVDYNNDGTFQASEEIYSHVGTQFAENHSFQYAVPTVLTVPSLISCVPLRMRVVADNSPIASITSCSQLTNGQVEDYSIIIRGGGPAAGAVTIAQTQGGNPSCFFSPLTFTATPGAGITNPTYQWLLNNNPTGNTGSTFTTPNLINNDAISVKMKFVGACGIDSAISNVIVVQRAATVPPTVSIALQSGTNPGCAGQTLVFKATATNQGTAPIYQWKVNGNNMGTNSDTFSSVLNNGDIITVELTSNSSCASPANAASNTITIQQVTLTADIAITANTTLTCAGVPITFTANVTDGGSNPQYQWFVNSSPVSTATASMFTTSTLNNLDTVYAVFTATDVCVANTTDTSNRIVLGIAPTDTPIVTVAITKGSNPGCLDSLIEFTATVTDHGSNPNYEWFVNSNPVATGLVFSSNTLVFGDVVTFVSTATDGACYTQNTVVDNTTLSLYSTPASPVISLINNMLVANTTSTTLQWFGPRGMIDSATGTSYHPDTTGLYYVVANNNGCYSAPSNKLLVSLLGVGEYDLSKVNVYPNPTKGLLTFDWGAKATTVRLTVYNVNGQGLMYEEVIAQTKKTIDLTRFVNGIYYVAIRDEQGNTATIPIVINK